MLGNIGAVYSTAVQRSAVVIVNQFVTQCSQESHQLAFVGFGFSVLWDALVTVTCLTVTCLRFWFQRFLQLPVLKHLWTAGR